MVTRILSLWLILSLAAPSPVLALKVQTARETGLEEDLADSLGRRSFLKTCGLAAITLTVMGLGPAAPAEDAKWQAMEDEVLERLYADEWDRPPPRWRPYNPRFFHGPFQTLLRLCRDHDDQWETVATRVQRDRSNLSIFLDAKFRHEAFYDAIQSWLKTQGVTVSAPYTPRELDTLTLHTLVDYLASQGIVFDPDQIHAMPVVQRERVLVGSQPAQETETRVTLVHYFVPTELYRVLAVRPDHAVEVERVEGPPMPATLQEYGFSAFGTAFVNRPSLTALVQEEQADRAGYERQRDFWDKATVWKAHQGFEDLKRGVLITQKILNLLDAIRFSRTKLLMSPSWRLTATGPEMVEADAEASSQTIAHEQQHLQDHQSRESRIRRLARLVAANRKTDAKTFRQRLEAVRWYERRARIVALRVAPRRWLMDLLNVGPLLFTDEWPAEWDLHDIGMLLAQRDLFQGLLEEVHRDPSAYGIEVHSASEIPEELQLLAQLDHVADHHHPERAARLADALARRFWDHPGSGEVRRATGWLGWATTIALFGAAYWQYRRMSRAEEAEGEAPRAAGAEESRPNLNRMDEAALARYLSNARVGVLEHLEPEDRLRQALLIASAIVRERDRGGRFRDAQALTTRLYGQVTGVKNPEWAVFVAALSSQVRFGMTRRQFNWTVAAGVGAVGLAGVGAWQRYRGTQVRPGRVIWWLDYHSALDFAKIGPMLDGVAQEASGELYVMAEDGGPTLEWLVEALPDVADRLVTEGGRLLDDPDIRLRLQEALARYWARDGVRQNLTEIQDGSAEPAVLEGRPDLVYLARHPAFHVEFEQPPLDSVIAYLRAELAKKDALFALYGRGDRRAYEQALVTYYEEYARGARLRDELFAAQVRALVAKHPEATIIVYRGASHQAVPELVEDYRVGAIELAKEVRLRVAPVEMPAEVAVRQYKAALRQGRPIPPSARRDLLTYFPALAIESALGSYGPHSGVGGHEGAQRTAALFRAVPPAAMDQLTRELQRYLRQGPRIATVEDWFDDMARYAVPWLRQHGYVSPETQARLPPVVRDAPLPQLGPEFRAGLEEYQWQDLLDEFPRLVVPGPRESSQGRWMETTALQQHYRQFFASEPMRVTGVTPHAVARTLRTVEAMERHYRDVIPGAPSFDFLELVDTPAVVARTVTMDDPPDRTRHGLVIAPGAITPEMVPYATAHELGERLQLADPRILAGHRDQVAGDITAVELSGIVTGFHENPYLRTPPLPADHERQRGVRDLWVTERGGPPKIWDVVADAVAIHLARERPEILDGLRQFMDWRTRAITQWLRWDPAQRPWPLPWIVSNLAAYQAIARYLEELSPEGPDAGRLASLEALTRPNLLDREDPHSDFWRAAYRAAFEDYLTIVRGVTFPTPLGRLAGAEELDLGLSRRTFLAWAATAMGIPGREFLPRTLAISPSTLMAQAVQEERGGQFLTYEGLERSPTRKALKAMPMAERVALVGGILRTNQLRLNTRYDALTTARDKASILLTPLVFPRDDTPPDRDTITREIASDPVVTLAALLFTQPEISPVGLDVLAPPPTRRGIGDVPQEALQHIGIDLPTLNRALRRFGEAPVAVGHLMGRTPWGMATRLRREALQSSEEQRRDLAAWLLWERVQLQVLLMDQGFHPPAVAVLDQLVLARRVLHEAAVPPAMAFASDDQIVNHRAFSEAFQELRQRGANAPREVLQAVATLAVPSPRRAAAAAQALWQVTDGRRVDEGTNRFDDTVQQPNPFYEALVLHYSTRRPEDQASFLQRLLARPGGLTTSERVHLLYLLERYPFRGSRATLALVKPLLEFKKDANGNASPLVKPSLRWLITAAVYAEDPSLQRQLVDEVRALLIPEDGRRFAPLIDSLLLREALVALQRVAEQGHDGPTQDVLGLYERVMDDPEFAGSEKEVALASWTVQQAGTRANHPGILKRFQRLAHGDAEQQEAVISTAMRLRRSDNREVRALIEAVIPHLPARLRDFVEDRRVERSEQRVSLGGLIFYFRDEAARSQISRAILQRIADMVHRYNQYLEPIFRIQEVLIEGTRRNIGARTSPGERRITLDYGLVVEELPGRSVAHELMHRVEDQLAPAERALWTALFRLMLQRHQRMAHAGRVPLLELVDDSNYYFADPDPFRRGDYYGHPADAEFEMWASAATAFERNPELFAAYISHALDLESRVAGLLIWGYLRDRHAYLLTAGRRDPFEWVQAREPLGLLPPQRAGAEERRARVETGFVLVGPAAGALTVLTSEGIQAIGVVSPEEAQPLLAAGLEASQLVVVGGDPTAFPWVAPTLEAAIEAARARLSQIVSAVRVITEETFSGQLDEALRKAGWAFKAIDQLLERVRTAMWA